MIKTVTLTKDWVLLSTNVAMIQFVEDALMQIGSETAPTGSVGFIMGEEEKFVSSITQNVWARAKHKETTYAIVYEL